MKYIVYFISVICASLLIVSCDKEDRVSLQKISIDPTSLNIQVGASQKLKLTAEPSDYVLDKVAWSVKDKKIASVDNNGLVKALSVGETEVYADAEGKRAICKVVVKPQPVTSMRIVPSEANLQVGQSLALSVKVVPDDPSSKKNLIWSSSDKAVATVEKNGIVSALSPGRVIIYASIGDVKAECHLVVGNNKNPLFYVAEFNLEAVNKFASGDPQITMGGIFQWGRNVFFDNKTETIDTYDNQVAPDDARVWGNLYFTNKHDKSWMTGSTKTDTWSSVVMKAHGAPKSYIGDNGGDPCPKGYHIPTSSQGRIFTGMYKVGPNFKLNSDYSGTETVNFQGHNMTYTAQYRATPNNIVYGIKMKGVSNDEYACVFKWEKMSKNNVIYLKITARHVGVEVRKLSLDNISNPQYWEKDNKNDISRYFPSAGFRYNDDGSLDGVGENGEFWCADTGFENHAWHIITAPDLVSTFYRARTWGQSIRCVSDAY